jgi:hypothetical protein
MIDSNLISGILRICGAFNKYNVQYMIVGGMAVALHGYFRKSINITGAPTEKPDLDFWIIQLTKIIIIFLMLLKIWGKM